MTRTGQEAIDYARSRVGGTMPDSGLCLQFVRTCFDVPSYYYSAIDAWNGSPTKHPDDWNPPPGVPLYFRSPSQYDHVVFCCSPSELVSTFNAEIRSYSSIDAVCAAFDATLLGWTEDINRVTVWTGEDDMPSADEVAAAVWNYTIHGSDPRTGAPWSDGAAAWLRDARVDSQPDYAAGKVWGWSVAGADPLTGEPWSDVASAWLRDGRADSHVGAHYSQEAATSASVTRASSLTLLALVLVVAVILGLIVAASSDSVTFGIYAGGGAAVNGMIAIVATILGRQSTRLGRHHD